MPRKIIKHELRKIYRSKEVSVTKGRGTASGWIDVDVTVPPSHDCYCSEGTCAACIEKRKREHDRISGVIRRLKEEKKIELYTYTSDDGIGGDSDCLLIQVRVKNLYG